jgi:predicted MFS family arabinose efflux permease
MAAVGEAVCFAINAVSFAAVLGALVLVHTRAEGGAAADRESWREQISGGLRFARSNRIVRVLLTLVVVTSIFGMPYTILMPVFARDVLDVGSRGLGFLMGASGLGAMIGALYVAGRRSVRRSGPLVAAAQGTFGAALVAFAWSPRFAVSLPVLVVVGGAMIAQLSTSNALLQLEAPGNMRGRIVSLYMMSFIGMAPIGSLLSGWLAREVGAPLTVAVGGSVCLVSAVLLALWLWLRRR